MARRQQNWERTTGENNSPHRRSKWRIFIAWKHREAAVTPAFVSMKLEVPVLGSLLSPVARRRWQGGGGAGGGLQPQSNPPIPLPAGPVLPGSQLGAPGDGGELLVVARRTANAHGSW